MGEKDEETLVPMIEENFSSVNEDVSDQARFLASLGALLWNVDGGSGSVDRGKIQELIAQINEMVNDQINEIIHHPKFQELESTWRDLFGILENTNFRANVMVDILDVSKKEIAEDFQNNSVDFTGSDLFNKVYFKEYDQYGGLPYGSIAGLYKFEHTPGDLKWLKMMGKVANASHAPFISSVSPQFFGCETIEELAAIKDLEGLMSHPKYGAFNALRDAEEAAYLGLCLPSYISRLPWDPVTNPCGEFNFKEYTWGDDESKYLWGNAAALFARNLIKSFESSGWCQYIRGPKAGGLVSGLPVHTFNCRGEEEIKTPVEMVIPDFRELEFANSGFIPLIYRKGTGEACFFSAQSLKRPKAFTDPKDSENAQLVCNLPYTFSITRIAHYVKSIARDNIGSTADAVYIQRMLSRWINNYVTAVTDPDDRTLRRFPFKAASIEVKEKEGKIGWYDCSICVLPHLQMEGLDVELRLESRLG
ncbi:MAG: type VI secretion system contractile sheath large subunit [Chlamydiia bacterium]|nr:type VI secretion system contractile sheath large subunit [Chlamydiia bacterium]